MLTSPGGQLIVIGKVRTRAPTERKLCQGQNLLWHSNTDPDVCRISLKRYWIYFLVGALFQNAEKNGKVIRNLRLGLHHDRTLINSRGSLR